MVKILNDAILEHESKDTTYANCEKLAWLYIVRDHCAHQMGTASIEPIADVERTATVEILPSFSKYAEFKKAYKIGDASKDKVLQSFNALILELKDFLNLLYSNTDTEEEREILHALIKDLQRV